MDSTRFSRPAMTIMKWTVLTLLFVLTMPYIIYGFITKVIPAALYVETEIWNRRIDRQMGRMHRQLFRLRQRIFVGQHETQDLIDHLAVMVDDCIEELGFMQQHWKSGMDQSLSSR
ncbi:hypothetical protein PG996_012488 [Apiospora saccharicola]|uniref:Uncharacterized protein n=1 Tax=Apiospora saccharicola TaxID=335842 RepID=A0ABR1U2Q3_9PEZI